MTLLSETKIEYYYKTATGAVPKFTFPFSNREEYVKWRTAWRSKYADLSKEIRTNKQKRRDAALELKNIDISEHWNTAHAELQRCLAELKKPST
ncbi:MAG: hypothetical protein HC836_35670 [Richelia sp. RM2_1_2]|nr:hypothetical protein [Richelia sp. RM2_1_2]